MQKIKNIFNKIKENKRVLITVLGVFVLLLLCGGVTFAIFNYSNEAFDNGINSGHISMTYTEPSNEYIIENALPMKDLEGINSTNYFEFSVTTTAKTNSEDDNGVSIPYEITITESEGNTLSNDKVKMYLTEVEGEKEFSHTNPSLVSLFEPSLYKNVGTKIGFKLHLHKNGNEKITTKYRLRAWIDFDVDATNWYKEDKYEYKFRVNVNGEATYQGYTTDLSCFDYEKYKEGSEEFYQITGYDFNSCDSKNIVVPSYIEDTKTVLFKEIKDFIIIDEAGFAEIYKPILFEEVCSGYDDWDSCLIANNATQEELEANIHEMYIEVYNELEQYKVLIGQNYYDYKEFIDDALESDYYLMGLIDIKLSDEEQEKTIVNKIKVNRISSLANAVAAVNNDKNINSINNLNNVVRDYKNNTITVADETISVNSIILPEDVIIGTNLFSNLDVKNLYDKAGNFPVGCFYFNSDGNGVTINRYICDGVKNVRIPSYVDDIKVLAIAENTFSSKKLNSVILPQYIETIGKSAFSYNNLVNIDFPSSLKEIGSYSFSNNKLYKIELIDNVSIGYNSFASNNLDTVILPDTAIIDTDSFVDNRISKIVNYDNKFSKNCLTYTSDGNEITITDFKCRGLANLEVPLEIDGLPVTAIADRAFYGDNIEKVKISDNIVSIGSEAFYIGYDYDAKIVDLDLGNSVTSVGDRAFYYNEIENLKIPNSLKTIGESAFAFNNLKKLYVPSTIETIGNYAFSSNDLLMVEFEEGITTLGGEYAFSGNKIRTLKIPKSITSISNYAFERNNIAELEIPSNVLEIGKYSFYSNQLKRLKLSNGVTTIGQSAFSFNDLKTISLPNSVVSVQNAAFENNDLSSVKFSDNMTSIEEEVFHNNNFENIIIPDNITTIGDSAFSYNKLTSVKLPDTLTGILAGAFQNNLLKTIELPDDLKKIGASAFSNNKLEALVIPDAVTSIGGYAFNNNRLKKIKIPSGVDWIWYYTFNNNRLEEVILHDNIEKIGYYAFSNNNLTEIDLPENLVEIGSNAFSGNDLREVVIPSKVTTIESRAFLKRNYQGTVSNINLNKVVNKTGRKFDWQNIVGMTKGTAFVTGTVNGVEIVAE